MNLCPMLKDSPLYIESDLTYISIMVVCSEFCNAYGLGSDRYTFCQKCFNDIQGDTVTLGDDPTQAQTCKLINSDFGMREKLGDKLQLLLFSMDQND
ncbi:hypothetical protein NQ317_013821 [Molorchus minor]|uniref:Uncharacterized protein n=1 Tax=Molorchus minor TaxID=1323400 RepID=A0ABQ9JS95_9CUCU|nr:hypothetical protein NQ317_013821 [Molorchus minor]